ncbi:MAG: SDR family NAD(P)-dependent oxidoreductase [Bacteroidales bacterium]|nr:SDR family NAD(P)-dependent oxidoreductase [Bacteroidales bacterium]
MGTKSIDQYSLITGASSGIGKALAIECGRRKMNLLLVSLPECGLADFSEELKQTFQVQTYFLEVDLTESSGPSEVFEWVEKEGFKINMLINNAGIGSLGDFSSHSLEKIDYMVHLNIRAVLLLTSSFIPSLKKADKGYIMNVGSILSYAPVPYKSMYGSSKAFIYIFSLALREELRKTDISVSVLTPGPSPTNAEVTSRIESGGFFAKKAILSPEKIARIGLDGLLKGKASILPGKLNKMMAFSRFIIPPKISLRILGYGFRRNNRRNGASVPTTKVVG